MSRVSAANLWAGFAGFCPITVALRQPRRSAVTVLRTAKKTAITSTETQYYITSLGADPAVILKAIRSNWRIENNLHWQLDVSFDEDCCCLRKDDAALNFAVFRRFAINMLKRERTKPRSNENASRP